MIQETSFLRYFLSRALVAVLFGVAKPFGDFGHNEEHFYEINLNWTSGSGGRCRFKIFLI